jgi:hypothetical protein
MPLAALVMYRMKSEDLAQRLFDGEVLSLALEERHVVLGVAKRQLFVVAVVADATPQAIHVARQLRETVAKLLQHTSDPMMPPPSTGGDSGSGPAELPLVEYGITVGRERGKA